MKTRNLRRHWIHSPTAPRSKIFALCVLFFAAKPPKSLSMPFSLKSDVPQLGIDFFPTLPATTRDSSYHSDIRYVNDVPARWQYPHRRPIPSVFTNLGASYLACLINGSWESVEHEDVEFDAGILMGVSGALSAHPRAHRTGTSSSRITTR
jgi:hypothetical protein